MAEAEARWRFLIRTLNDVYTTVCAVFSEWMNAYALSDLQCDSILHTVMKSEVRCQIQIGISYESVPNGVFGGALNLAELLATLSAVQH